MSPGGVGVVSYLYVYPRLFPAAEPVAEQPSVEKPAEPVIPPVPKVVHKSFLTIAADLTEEARISAVDLGSASGALRQSAADKRAPGTFKEIVFTGPAGFVASSDLFSVLVPELNLKNSFEDDYTAGVYYDETGVWPVYILKLKAGALIAEAQLAVSRLESSLNLKNLFAGDPGVMGRKDLKTAKSAIARPATPLFPPREPPSITAGSAITSSSAPLTPPSKKRPEGRVFNQAIKMLSQENLKELENKLLQEKSELGSEIQNVEKTAPDFGADTDSFEEES